MVDRARHGDDDVLGAIVGPIVAPHRVTGDRADGLGAAADGAAERMVAEHGLEEPLARDVGGVIVGRAELLEDHAALVVELVLLEQRGGEHVGDDVDRHRQVAVLDLGVVAGVLLGRQGVVLAADGVEAHRDVERAAGRSALEQEVLKKMGRAVGRRHLVARPDGHPIPDGRAPRPGNPFAEDSHAARQNASSDERVAGRDEGEFRDIEGQGYGTGCHRTSLRHPRASGASGAIGESISLPPELGYG